MAKTPASSSRALVPDSLRDFAWDVHPIYKRRRPEWALCEAAAGNADSIKDRLQAYDWEYAFLPSPGREGAARVGSSSDSPLASAGSAGSEASLADYASMSAYRHYQIRQETATYINFPRKTAEKFVGYLAEKTPTPGQGLDFGNVGPVRPKELLSGSLSLAEHLYYDIDREGTSSAQFFDAVTRMAFVTGHRWVLAEAPPRNFEGPVTAARRDAGHRPYAVHLSPLSVPNWHYAGGRLRVASIKTTERSLVDSGKYSGSDTEYRFVYVDAECDDFGPAVAGRWFKIDDDGRIFAGGDLLSTSGRIPLVVHYYSPHPEEFSVSGAKELVAVMIAHMNLSSAGDNDAIEAGGSSFFILGAGSDANQAVARQRQLGTRMYFVPGSEDHEGRMNTPTFAQSSTSEAQAAIDLAIARKKDEAALIAADEMIRGPQTSGEARLIEFLDVKAPRLGLMAYHRERAEQRTYEFLAQRGGIPSPRLSVSWPRRFDIKSELADWTAVLDLAFTHSVRSPTLVSLALVDILRNRTLVTDEAVLSKIETEVLSSVQASVDAAAQSSDALAAARAGASDMDAEPGASDAGGVSEDDLPAAQ